MNENQSDLTIASKRYIQAYKDIVDLSLRQYVLGSLALQNTQESDSDLSEMSAMQLQMLMSARSELLQTASNIEKSISDTSAALIQNLKQ